MAQGSVQVGRLQLHLGRFHYLTVGDSRSQVLRPIRSLFWSVEKDNTFDDGLFGLGPDPSDDGLLEALQESRG